MPADKDTIQTARALRRRMSPPEVHLWTALRGRKLESLRFRRQHPRGPYVLDFYGPAARLAVQVDGRGHDDPDRMRRDGRRDVWLAEQDIRVLRLPAGYVLENIDGAVEAVLRAAWGGSS
jgi:very-short-patch-repair endonuclease